MSQTLGSLAVGAKIKDASTTFLGSPIIWLKADKDHTDYPSNSTTLIAEKILAFRAFDAIEPNNTDSNRAKYGNNKYSVSNIDQWLNSDAAAGQWYSARHDADQAPTELTTHVSANTYTEDAGFLNGFSVFFKKNLLDTTLKTVLNTVTDGGSYESITRKIFLASTTEVGLANENSIAEGSILSLFSANTNADRIAYVTQECVDDSDYSSDPAAGAAWYWWLRTPNSSNSRYVRVVISSGTLSSGNARGGNYGVRPLCNLSSDILVSDTVDEDGCYVIEIPPEAPTELKIKTPVFCDAEYNTGGIEGGVAEVTWNEGYGDVYKLERSINGGVFKEVYVGDGLAFKDTISSNMNTIQYRVAAVLSGTSSEYTTSEVVVVQDNYPPFISGDNSALGDTAVRIKYDYTVYDGDDVNLNVEEYINETLIRSYTATGSTENTLEVDLETWNGLAEGDNYIKIVVTDDEGSTVTQTKHFNKLGGVIELNYVPFGSELTVCPKVANVKLDLKRPLDSTVSVLITNNGNDTQPVWDDITTAALSGHNHVFTNTAKEQGVDYYSVQIKVKINRNGADGEIKLYGISCQLDCVVG